MPCKVSDTSTSSIGTVLPKALVVALAEGDTHAFVAVEIEAYSVGEKTLAGRLYPRLRPDELLIADRSFYSFDGLVEFQRNA